MVCLSRHVKDLVLTRPSFRQGSSILETRPRRMAIGASKVGLPFVCLSFLLKCSKLMGLLAPQAVPDRTKATGNANGRAPLFPGLQFASSSSFGNATTPKKAEQATPATQNTPGSSSAPKTLQTVQKEAQLAILRLLPLGVKYQNYIEEGIDEKVVKKLYNNLHLDIPKPASETTTTTTSTQKAAPGKVSSPVPTSPQTTKVQQQQPAPVVFDAASATEQPSKEESRKDRIARLMAAKAEKATKPSVVPGPKAPSVPATKRAPAPVVMAQPSPVFAEAKGAPAAAQEKPAGDTAAPKPKLGPKELLLQLKIAALQKSREAQKQEQANIKPQAATTGLADKATSSPIPNSAASAGLKNGISQPQAPANVPVAVSTIPGLHFSGTPNVQPALPANPRKRRASMNSSSPSILHRINIGIRSRNNPSGRSHHHQIIFQNGNF